MAKKIAIIDKIEKKKETITLILIKYGEEKTILKIPDGFSEGEIVYYDEKNEDSPLSKFPSKEPYTSEPHKRATTGNRIIIRPNDKHEFSPKSLRHSTQGNSNDGKSLPSPPARDIMYLPKDTREAMFEVSNFGLQLNKYIAPDAAGKYILYSRENDNSWKPPRFNTVPFDQICARKKKSAEARHGKQVQTLNLQVRRKAVTGLGSPSVFESGILLDPVYGYPYFSGESLKGIVRSHMINECFEGKESLALDNKFFSFLFGTAGNTDQSGARGKVIFCGGQPLDTPQIDVDVVNNHYKPYYEKEGTQPPADYYNPEPHFFLCIKQSAFQFLVCLPDTAATLQDGGDDWKSCIPKDTVETYDTRLNKLDGNSKLSEFLQLWIEKTMDEAGIGARTRTGYGKMSKKDA